MGKEINLGIFASDNIQSATLGLLSDLGIDMEVRSQQQIPIPAVVAASLGQTPKAVQDICDKIAKSYLAGIISDKTFTGEEGAASFEEACENAGRYEQMMVFAVDFKKSEKITRTEMATLTRALNRASKACPVVLVCRYTDEESTRFALSLCERTAYKQAGHTGEKVGKVNILRGINPENPHTGHVRILEDMRLERKDNTFEAVYDKWFGVFDNDVLTNQFYKELQDWFFWAIKHVQFPNDIEDDKDDQKYNPQNVIRLITRLIFVWFLRQKGLVPKELFNREDLAHLVKDFEPDNFESSTYYRVILQNLFFATLNKKIDERAFISDNFIENRYLGKHKIKTFMRHARDLAVSKEEFINLVRPVPFMNNSLFECLDNKEQNGRTYNWDGFSDSNKPQRQAFVPNYLFFAKEEYVDLSKEYDRASASSTKVFGLLNILKRYNFTVEENTPLDQDVALDPELLGKVFENLLAAYNPETEKTVRKSTGSYYTPRPIVQYMVDESLVAYLKKSVPDVKENTLRSLLSYSDDDQASTLNEKQTRDIVEAILNCKVLDPACGSGAFPMGMLQQMSHLLSRVDASNKYWEEVVINRALNDVAFVDKMNDEEKEAHKNEIEEVFKLSVNYPDYARKLYLIENCIYGVDLQSIAVQISRLRFFISLLCEQQPTDDASKNYNIKPLPNLEMKFVSANTLVRLEHIEEARELFANKDILDLIAQLKGVRHELFVVTDHHVKEKLLTKDETLRHQIMLSTGDCYVKGTEDKIKEYKQTLARLEKELAVAERQPDDIVQQSVQYNLFGDKTEVITVNRKETKIKEITGQIRYFNRECKRLKETLTSGRDKAMRLAKQLTDWNPYDQNVSSPFFDPEWMFGIKTPKRNSQLKEDEESEFGFDVIIGNPPYIKEYTYKDAFDCIRGTEYYQGKMDLWYCFACQGIDMLSTCGSVCYIATNNWTTNSGASILRNKVVTDSTITKLVDFNDYMVFGDSASIQTMIMMFARKNDETSYNFDYSKLTKEKATIQDVELFMSKQLIDATYLTPSIDRVANADSLLTFNNSEKDSILSNMTSGALFLTDKELAQGIVFPQDFLNKKGQAKLGCYNIGDGIFGLSNQELIDLNLSDAEKELIKPYFTSSEIKRYYADPNNTLWMIYTDSSYKSANSLDKYPNIKSHLDKFITIFTSDNKPYGLHRARNEYFFKDEKVVVQRKCVGNPIFSYVPFDSYVTQTYYCIKSPRFDAKYLTVLLNTKIIEFWLRNKGKMQGENFQLDKEPLLQIPIKIDNSERYSSLCEKIITKAQSLENFDKEANEIDMLTYNLYGLSYEEILIVDPDTSISRDEYENL